jgi:geranylgeranyl diphosphate synthase, type II
MEPISSFLQSRRRLIDVALDGYLPSVSREPAVVHRCMHYSAEGGKRLRPIITLAVAEMLRCTFARSLPTCVAIEMIHIHSLILDDLPCMDNDDYRRGRPASHREFGEAVALLSADALLNLAISILGANHRLAGIPADTALEVIREVGESVGTDGVIGGQMADLSFFPVGDNPGTLERIHLDKTAKLFRLSARAGALIAGASAEGVDRMGNYGERLGLAFQIVDDILDHAEGNGETSNRSGVEPSYSRALSPERAHLFAAQATEEAMESVSGLGKDATMLRAIARYNLQRVT